MSCNAVWMLCMYTKGICNKNMDKPFSRLVCVVLSWSGFKTWRGRSIITLHYDWVISQVIVSNSGVEKSITMQLIQFASLMYRENTNCIYRRLHMGKCAKRWKYFKNMQYQVCKTNIYLGHKTQIAIFENHFPSFYGA